MVLLGKGWMYDEWYWASVGEGWEAALLGGAAWGSRFLLRGGGGGGGRLVCQVFFRSTTKKEAEKGSVLWFSHLAQRSHLS